MDMIRLQTLVMPDVMKAAFEEASDQALWITHLVLCSSLNHLGVTEMSVQLTGEEISRRWGEDASERASQFFTNGRFTHEEMINFVGGEWEAFLKEVRHPKPLPEYVQGLIDATDEELGYAVQQLTPEQRTMLRQFLGASG